MRRVFALGAFGALALLAPALAAAQGRITGTVRDTTGEALIGVNVIVVGTQRGAVTDLDGQYTINDVGAGTYNLQFSYIGYATKLFTAIRVRNGEATTLDVTLGEADVSNVDEVVVVGDRPLVDVEAAASVQAVTREQIEAAPVRSVQGVIATQAGVNVDPTGLYIRGGRAIETGFIVDGVSAKDPLSGTGFGLDLGSNAFSEVEVTTGGVGADVGDVTSGVVSVRTQEGGDTFSGSFAHKRDDFGFNSGAASNFREELYELSIGGPILKRKLRFFVSGQVQLEDGFTRETSNPDQLRSSLVDGTFWMPRAANRWNGLAKLTYEVRTGLRVQGSYQRSLSVNQNTRSLQVTGDEAVVAPGFQYAFILQPDNANTYAHDTNIGYLRLTHALSARTFYELQASRLFTRLRADANGRDWRPDVVDAELDPESLPTYPGNVYTGANGTPPDPNALFILPGPGFYNNGGIATRWHDHFAEEYTLRGVLTTFFGNRSLRLDAGFEHKRNDYQWIDVVRPWVGAPIITAGGDTTASNRLGSASDIWRVQPQRGAFFGTGQARYRGLIANVGLRFEYWAAGKYVDRLVADSLAPILGPVRQSYLDGTTSLFGLRWKARLLPKLRVSFPIKDNQVLYFNYGHSTRLPHPTFTYTGLDPFYQDRSFFADLGNPDLNPEVDISYEIGLKSQITANDVLTVTGFWRDKFDFITVQDAVVRDPSGRETVRAFRVNGDFARVRGLEAGYLKRIGRNFTGQVSATVSRTTGLSSTSNDALAQYLQQGGIDNSYETPLAWDRPYDLKASVTFSRGANQRPLWGVPGLRNYRLYVSSTFRAGQRYTPVEFVGRTANPVTGALDWRPVYRTVQDPSKRYSKVGAPWWWFDLNLQRTFVIAGNNLAATLEVTNLFDQDNGVIINPVTGKAYPRVADGTDFAGLRENADYDVAEGVRDPRYEDPRTEGLPPFNPARYLPQRHILLGVSYRF